MAVKQVQPTGKPADTRQPIPAVEQESVHIKQAPKLNLPKKVRSIKTKPAVARESAYSLVRCNGKLNPSGIKTLSEDEYKTLMTVLAVCREDKGMARAVKRTPDQRVTHRVHLAYLRRHAFVEDLKREKAGRKVLAELQRPNNIFVRIAAFRTASERSADRKRSGK